MELTPLCSKGNDRAGFTQILLQNSTPSALFSLAFASTHFYKSSFDVSSGLDALERMGEKETALLVTLG